MEPGHRMGGDHDFWGAITPEAPRSESADRFQFFPKEHLASAGLLPQATMPRKPTVLNLIDFDACNSTASEVSSGDGETASSSAGSRTDFACAANESGEGSSACLSRSLSAALAATLEAGSAAEVTAAFHHEVEAVVREHLERLEQAQAERRERQHAAFARTLEARAYRALCRDVILAWKAGLTAKHQQDALDCMEQENVKLKLKVKKLVGFLARDSQV
mmetsp:Transcript_38638/g.63521  ORF Transcript_38638/g.63521 Transcript_38638/m.63521 type:complete len:219 (-) Transcript_38638:106-762(-)